jgi:Holliday junction resolvase
MSRRAAKVDANQPEIVAEFRAWGCSVALTHGAGAGFPDCVVGYRGQNLLVEIKDGSKIPSKQKLTGPQVEFHENWRGQICVVKSTEEVADIIRALRS